MRRPGLILALGLIVACGLLVWHATRFNFVTDDAYISFVYARNLADHGQLVFNLGQYVEGYTNFLWTVIVAGGLKLGLRAEPVALSVAMLCSLVTLGVTVRSARRLGLGLAASLTPALLLASSAGFACWTSGGLESALFAMLVACVFDLVLAATPRAPSAPATSWQLPVAGLLLALAAMTRPEGLLITGLVGAHRLLTMVIERRWRVQRQDGLMLAAFLLLWAPWFAWRYWYYGWPFPNTYYVKAHGPWQPARLASEMADVGWHYVWVWIKQVKLLWALPVVVGAMIWHLSHLRRDYRARVLSAPVAFALWFVMLVPPYLYYVASVGGDFMGLHRFILVLFPPVALAVAVGLEALAAFAARLSPQRPRVRRAVVGGLAIVVVGSFALTQWRLSKDSRRPGNYANDRGIDTPAFLITYTEDRAKIGRAMAPCFRDDDVSIVGGAGAQPYFGRMRAIDVFGLVSEEVAHTEPRIRARAGHTKWGRDDLMASYGPTFVFSCYELHRTPVAPKLPCATSWAARGFVPATMHVPGMQERGEYYTFLVKRDRQFACPGLVPNAANPGPVP